jgi:hypothetical protein
MRFILIMNMAQRGARPSDPGTFTHQIFIEHPADNIAEFMRLLDNSNFIMAKELYKDPMGDRELSEGKTIGINTHYIAKVRPI